LSGWSSLFGLFGLFGLQPDKPDKQDQPNKPYKPNKPQNVVVYKIKMCYITNHLIDMQICSESPLQVADAEAKYLKRP
jgi:hypothetical protein